MKLADVTFWHLAIVPESLRARPLLKVNPAAPQCD
jgi:hypothetical protein